MIWQYSSFKYYTWCSEKNDFLVPEGPSIKLGPEIIKKVNSLSRQLKEKMDNLTILYVTTCSSKIYPGNASLILK